ncbi:GPW/gp25 family protein [Tamlana agarivorans]|uniref:GPW/gp25 family protein n=1 Tax=Pseudotamlana agarivorans TaxID=481183 RepID=A0ACC5U4N8_9FLAO|nr:GPW/gp25 family protein [Tamlana agarivorans]MBU2949238.1 GPW/gp25 family protein [Tamlana agarivorans]
MQHNYYKFPLNATALIQNRSIEKSNIEVSIANYIHLIMTTRFGECHFDPSFGSAIWDVDFNNIGSDNKLRTMVLESLIKSLKTYETRLSNIEFDVHIAQEEINLRREKSRIKKGVSISVNGVIKKINEAFSYKEHFFIAPLSY